jgi:hypothetical protein
MRQGRYISPSGRAHRSHHHTAHGVTLNPSRGTQVGEPKSDVVSHPPSFAARWVANVKSAPLEFAIVLEVAPAQGWQPAPYI